nr:MAG TPA: hypothetical protein [Caudoviricetes sp.]
MSLALLLLISPILYTSQLLNFKIKKYLQTALFNPVFIWVSLAAGMNPRLAFVGKIITIQFSFLHFCNLCLHNTLK